MAMGTSKRERMWLGLGVMDYFDRMRGRRAAVDAFVGRVGKKANPKGTAKKKKAVRKDSRKKRVARKAW
jgi:hypothetical protein